MKCIGKGKLGKKGVLNALINLAILGFMAGLLAYVYMGSFIRIIGDDYCYGGVLNKYGFFGAQVQSYLHKVPFHGDRYALNLVSFLISLFPPAINGWMPFITIAAFLCALYAFLHALVMRYSLRLSKKTVFLVALIIAFFTFLLAPTVKQSLYFRSAMLPSFAPIIGVVMLSALLLRRKPLQGFHFPLVFLISFLNAGLSENGAAFQAMAMGILFVFLLFENGKSGGSRRLALLPATAFLGTLMGVVVMWVSPSIAAVQEEMTLSLGLMLKLSFSHMLDFYLGVFRTQYLAAAVIFGLGCLISWIKIPLINDENGVGKIKIRGWLAVILVAQGVTLLLILSLMVPSAFTRLAYPDPRHLIGATMIVVMDLVVSGVAFGQVLITLGQNAGAKSLATVSLTAAVLVVIVALAYPVRYIPSITSERHFFQYWSEQWDDRHRVILAAVESGKREVHVMQLDHLIEGVGELSHDLATNWYTQCASDYYGIHIYADQPGWEEGFNDFLNKH